MKKKPGRVRRIVKWTFLTIMTLFVLAITASHISNRSLPLQSATPEILAANEYAVIGETLRLKRTFGNTVWPGFGDSGDEILFFNHRFAFLAGYPDPPDGYAKTPRMEERHGGSWESITGEPNNKMPLHRQEIDDPARNIGQFTVRVGDIWVPSYYTREQSTISLINLIRDSLPPVLAEIVPYRLINRFWTTDWYMMGLLHESFHAYAGNSAPERLIAAEQYASRMDNEYPWDDPEIEETWKRELDCLMQAMEAASDEDVAEKVRLALGQRGLRQGNSLITDELARGEREREWQEGLAKYVELRMWEEAAGNGYVPSPEIMDDPEFKSYRAFEQRRKEEMRLVRKQYNRSGDIRFYYSGMVQAMLLDRLTPEWKSRIFDEGVYLEDLLREAVEK